MKLGIITTFHGIWGGSEELWFRLAEEALAGGDSVVICLPLHDAGDDPHFKPLTERGARLIWNDNYRAERLVRRSHAIGRLLGRAVPPLFERPSARVHELAQEYRDRRSALRRFFAQGLDAVLINEGGSLPQSDLISETARGSMKTPYVILCHNNHGGIPDDERRRDVATFYHRAAHVCFVAEATRAATERQLGATISASIVRNPVNMTDTSEVPWPPDPQVRFAAIGQLRTEWKGQDLLLHALSRPHWRNRDWRLSIFGAGAQERYLGDLIRHYDLSDHVELAGHSGDIRRVWATHHALIVPSRIESAPLVIVEAMLCARPVIATDVGGITEWIDDGISGFVAAGATTNAIDDALEQAWAKRSGWERMGERARAEVVRRYDPNGAMKLLAEMRAIGSGCSIGSETRPQALLV